MNNVPSGRHHVSTSRNLFAWFLFALLLLSLYLSYQLVAPFLHTIILSSVFSASIYPFYRRLTSYLGERPVPAALLVLAGVVILVVIPVVVFVIGLIPQAVASVSAITRWLAGHGGLDGLNDAALAPYIAWVRENLPFIDPAQLDVRSSLVQASRAAGQTLLQWGTYVLGNTLLLFGHFLLLLLCMFFMLKDGAWMVQRVRYLSPLRIDQQDRIILELRRVGRSVLVGGLLVAVIQGLLGGVALAAVGIPALFWGTLMAFASLVPVVGTGLVWVPAVCYLLLTSQWESALFLSLWCGIVVVGADSILRPYFMRGGVGMPVFFIFLSILGGVKAFGMLGILDGPLILSFTVVMLSLYGDEYRDILDAGSLAHSRGAECEKGEASEEGPDGT
ncbi:AI-2E family transporter [Nitratidesulfovibrio vulgaris]|nr:AI-2E family transporter [Nitratidesulfovibrio vulgaris]ADP86258.1 protein of unknown function UPF0118 [Nitratidesulfovibrio vulgaris RCH1]WCB47751.1 AI-2E family transporter [Nitratidesulfovibrio vulgaris]GEB78941.1 AI-2E family transporter [Desulfovibrio desulfuricans]